MIDKVILVLLLEHDKLLLKGDSIDRRFGSQRRRRLHVVKPSTEREPPEGWRRSLGSRWTLSEGT